MTSPKQTSIDRVPIVPAVPAICLILAAVLVIFAPARAAADWTTTTDAPDGEDRPRDTARVQNSDGHTLDIFRDDNGTVRGIFSLSDDMGPLDEGSCPTFRIDAHPPRALTEFGGPCEVEGGSAHFTLGVVADDAIESTLLTQLMNGTRIVVWYHVPDRGYFETEFTLRRSMQALMGAIGGRVRVLPQ